MYLNDIKIDTIDSTLDIIGDDIIINNLYFYQVNTGFVSLLSIV
jgi:hypothetical protein